MIWKMRRPEASSVFQVVTANYAGDPKDFEASIHVPPQRVHNLEALGEILLESIDKEFLIVGDYDADGITATAILLEMLQYLGANASYHLPHRFTEGYGTPVSVIERSSADVLITVDNGITAFDAIKTAKEKGMIVLVLDHHVPGDALPDADVIVDPHVDPDKSDFTDYCGAGLALKLAELLVGEDDVPEAKAFLARATVYAMIGTIADVMPLIGDNRRIVKDGLCIARKENNLLSLGLRTIIKEAGIYDISEEDVAFKLAPLLNAPGRMYDDGANYSLLALTSEDYTTSKANAEKLAEINSQRKSAVDIVYQQADAIIRSTMCGGKAPICLYLPHINEGIIGIVTGKIAEAYRIPAFVFTDSAEPGILKASGRSYGRVNLKELVDSAADLLVRYGGHSGAAGLSVTVENFDAFTSRMQSKLEGYNPEECDELFYDLEIRPDQVVSAYEELKKYAPFGQGNPAPIFLVRDIPLSPRMGSHYKTMGQSNSHLKLFGNGFSIVAFGEAERYHAEAEPMRVNVVGTISENAFQYAREKQIGALDWMPAPNKVKTSPLMEALKRNGTI